MENRYEKFKQLLDMNGISGHEYKVRKYVKSELKRYTNLTYLLFVKAN